MAVYHRCVCWKSLVRQESVSSGEFGKAILQAAAAHCQLPGADRNAGAGRRADAAPQLPGVDRSHCMRSRCCLYSRGHWYG